MFNLYWLSIQTFAKMFISRGSWILREHQGLLVCLVREHQASYEFIISYNELSKENSILSDLEMVGTNTSNVFPET